MSNPEPMDYSSIILGDAMDVIVNSARDKLPRVTEAVFSNSVAPVLTKPFNHNNLVRYLTWVGELTNPLRVMSNDEPDVELFTVPALIPMLPTSLPNTTTATMDTVMQSIMREADRGVDVNPMIHDYMSKAIARVDIREVVLDPLREILKRYGYDIDLGDEHNTSDQTPGTTEGLAKLENKTDPVSDASFTGEYE